MSFTKKKEKSLPPKPETSLQNDLSYSLKKIEKYKKHSQKMTATEAILHLNEYQAIIVTDAY